MELWRILAGFKCELSEYTYCNLRRYMCTKFGPIFQYIEQLGTYVLGYSRLAYLCD